MSYLDKKIKKYTSYLQNWEKEVNIDSCIDEVKFKKKELVLVFYEDKREHMINFTILSPKYLILSIEYRQIINVNMDLLGVDILKSNLNKLKGGGKEKTELEIYFNFLRLNHFV